VVVHVFLDSVREFYEIERLYMDAPRVAWELPPEVGATAV
jgi:ribosomal silencing factor RsfS